MTLLIILMLFLLMLICGWSLGFQSGSIRCPFQWHKTSGLCLCLCLLSRTIRADSRAVIPCSHYNLYLDTMAQWWNFNGSYILWTTMVINCSALTSASYSLSIPNPPSSLLSWCYLNGDEVAPTVCHSKRKHLPAGMCVCSVMSDSLRPGGL